MFGPSLPIGQGLQVNPSYNLGYRLYAGALFEPCCSDVKFIFTHINTRTNRVFFAPDGTAIWGTQRFETGPYGPSAASGISSPAEVNLATDFDAGDVEMGYIKGKPGCLLRLFGGLHVANITQRFKLGYEGLLLSNPITNDFEAFDSEATRRRSWGVGPRLGAYVQRDLLCNVGVSGQIACALLAGESRQSEIQTLFDQRIITFGVDTFQGLALEGDSHNRLFPLVELRLGLSYHPTAFCCIPVLVEAGYEMRSYINALSRFEFNDERGTADGVQMAHIVVTRAGL